MPSITVLQSGVAGGFFLLFGLLLFAVYVGLIVWTYSDAQRNSPQPAVLWALVVFFAPFLGVLLYVLLGRGQL